MDNDQAADVHYGWDALGRRVFRLNSFPLPQGEGQGEGSATVFVQSGQQTIADYTAGTAASSPTYTYVFASYIDEPVMRGGLRYYHRNQQYSIVALTDGGGTIFERYAYDAYGDPTILDSSLSPLSASAEGNRYLYTGREWDEALNLYHYRARMYDPEAGRFCSRDPIGYADGKNLYEFVGSTPVNSVDPHGLFRGSTSIRRSHHSTYSRTTYASASPNSIWVKAEGAFHADHYVYSSRRTIRNVASANWALGMPFSCGVDGEGTGPRLGSSFDSSPGSLQSTNPSIPTLGVGGFGLFGGASGSYGIEVSMPTNDSIASSYNDGKKTCVRKEIVLEARWTKSLSWFFGVSPYHVSFRPGAWSGSASNVVASHTVNITTPNCCTECDPKTGTLIAYFE